MNNPDTNELCIDFCAAPICALETLIHSRYSVSPLTSYVAYEKFTMPDGEVLTLRHYVFGLVQNCRINEAKIEAMAKAIWEDIKAAWPPGTFLMWRQRPQIKEENDRDPGWFERGCDGPSHNAPDNWKTRFTLRIGSMTPPAGKFYFAEMEKFSESQ